ncbi:hypothetical protein WJX73_005723 [Symbiochloris irregularis]|uniref:Protein kinase domain-containing protein n=1 Tax=Symbiochloris irregularis TaxID=706552 RepID=A0AAW1P8K7_9CHLO
MARHYNTSDLSSFNSDESDDFSVDDALEQLGNGVGGVELSELVGRGAFGCVYRVLWKGRPAALKVIEYEHLDEDEEAFATQSPNGNGSRGSSSATRRSQALLEAAVSSAVHHPHVVETYDYQLVDAETATLVDPINILTGSMELRMLMEWCDAGSLMTALEDGRLQPVGPQGNPDGFEAICITLLEVAQAMHHLHCMHIVHCDLKAKNVLLSSAAGDLRGFTAKVSDFGLSKLVADSVGGVTIPEDTSKASGTVTHMAPELLANGRASPAADVYAFGILMWETYMGVAPYGELTKMQVLYGVVTEGLCPVFPTGAPAWFSRLASRCWAQQPDHRPTFAEIAADLGSKVGKLAELRARRHSSGGSSASTATHRHASRPPSHSPVLAVRPHSTDGWAGTSEEGEADSAGGVPPRSSRRTMAPVGARARIQHLDSDDLPDMMGHDALQRRVWHPPAN